MTAERDGIEVIVDVAEDFSYTPGGRYRAEGEFSGEEFRETKLEPLLQAGKAIVVDLDGPAGFTSSFLEEVFGGLVRKYSPDIRTRIRIRADAQPHRKAKAEMYLQRAVEEFSV